MKIVVPPRARQDLKEAAVYLARRNPAAAARFSRAANATLQMLGRFPRMGGLQEFANPALAGIRVWPIRRFKNYLIFYRVGVREIRVRRVLHGARDVESAFGE